MASIGQTQNEVRVGAVIGGAFALLVRRPFSVLAWGLYTLVFAVLPISFILLVLLPGMENTARAAVIAGQSILQPAVLIRLAGAYALIGLLLLVTLAVVDTAVFRAVLEPDNRGLFYLRLRRRELSLLRVHLVQALSWAGLLIVAAVPLAWLMGAATNAFGRSWAVLIGVAAVLVAACIIGLIGLRLSLAGPDAFAIGRQSLLKSWRMTRDRLGPILVTAVVMSAVLWLGAYLVQAAVQLSPFGAAAALIRDPRSSDPERLAIIAATMVVYLGVARVLIAAPAALIYRQLAPAPDPEVETAPHRGALL